MKTPKKLSPARSQGPVRTPIRHKNRRTLSVCSGRSRSTVRLTTLIKQSRNVDSFVLSPLGSRRSVLPDDTEIEEPSRNSWWKKLGENSRDVIELFDENRIMEPNNIIEELDMEILSQEKKNYSIDLPESSGSESINSIVIHQRKLFTQKDNLHQKKFGQIVGKRDTLANLDTSNTTVVEPTIKAGTRVLFQNKQRSKPIFPAALLNISPNKTAADKTRELATVELKAQIHNIFGNRATKRKNIFTNFIVSESEDEIPEIQPKLFGFQKKIEARRRGSSSSRGIREHSPTSSITTDIEMDDWKMLPSSTMVENQLEIMMSDGQSPKRTRLSKLTEIESEAGSNATRQSNKSSSSKVAEKSRKSKTFTKEKATVIETSMTTINKSKVAHNEEMLDDNRSTKDADKSRKSKTFTKEKAPEIETSMTTRNKSKLVQDDNEEILDNNRSMTKRNKSKVSQNDNEETLAENKSSKNIDKSRKSKTFIMEKELDLETSMTTKNKSNTYFPSLTRNKSKITDENLSQSSIEIKNKNSSPNSSLVIKEPNLNDKPQNSNKNKSKSIATSPKDKSKKKFSEEEPIADQGNDDDELNFTLEYDDENEEVPENINMNKSETRTSKSMSQKESSANLSKLNKVVEESVELESTQEKSNSIKVVNKPQAKDTSKLVEEDQIIENEELETDQHDAPNNSDLNNDRNEMNVDEKVESECKDVQDENQENISQAEDEEENDVESEVENNDENDVENNDESEVENNDDSVVQNVSEVNESQEQEEENDEQDEENDDQNEENNEKDESEEIQEQEKSLEVQNLSEPENESQLVEEENEDNNDESQGEHNESQGEHNESQEIEKEQNYSQEQEKSEVEDENEDNNDESQEEHNESEEIEKEQNYSHEQENVEQNESQEIEQENVSQEVEDENDDKDQNISQEEIEHDTDMEQNESGIEDNEDQNRSSIQDNEEQNESDDENEEESEAVADSDNENDESNQNLEEEANESDNQDNGEVESGQEIETPNVSHDTTGRNRKKNESPEVILHDSKNHMDSFAVLGRNTSVRKTEVIKSMHIRPSLASLRESTGLSDGTKNSSGEGSGWDSHRTTRKTLRQTFGKDFTPRKSLRALVMEKSAKRQTQHNDITSVTAKFPQANSTELPEITNRFDDDEVDEIQESNHEVSPRTRQTKLENYLNQIQKKNTETRLKIEEAVRESLKAPPKQLRDVFKVPAKPFFARRPKPTAKKQSKSTLLGELPEEVLEDFKYKPPKRFGPSNAPWITKRLYKFLETKLEPKYDYKARVRAEKLVEHIYHFSKDVRRRDVASSDAVDVLKREMARLDIVKTHFEFYEFFHQFMPKEVRIRVIPDILNNISLPKTGIFSDIL